jgi:hypothetical protein
MDNAMVSKSPAEVVTLVKKLQDYQGGVPDDVKALVASAKGRAFVLLSVNGIKRWEKEQPGNAEPFFCNTLSYEPAVECLLETLGIYEVKHLTALLDSDIDQIQFGDLPVDMWPTDAVGNYFFKRPDGLLVLGGEAQLDAGAAPDFGIRTHVPSLAGRTSLSSRTPAPRKSPSPAALPKPVLRARGLALSGA